MNFIFYSGIKYIMNELESFIDNNHDVSTVILSFVDKRRLDIENYRRLRRDKISDKFLNQMKDLTPHEFIYIMIDDVDYRDPPEHAPDDEFINPDMCRIFYYQKNGNKWEEAEFNVMNSIRSRLFIYIQGRSMRKESKNRFGITCKITDIVCGGELSIDDFNRLTGTKGFYGVIINEKIYEVNYSEASIL